MFSAPPKELNLALNAQRALLKILRFGPSWVTRDMLHTLGLLLICWIITMQTSSGSLTLKGRN